MNYTRRMPLGSAVGDWFQNPDNLQVVATTASGALNAYQQAKAAQLQRENDLKIAMMQASTNYSLPPASSIPVQQNPDMHNIPFYKTPIFVTGLALASIGGLFILSKASPKKRRR